MRYIIGKVLEKSGKKGPYLAVKFNNGPWVNVFKKSFDGNQQMPQEGEIWEVETTQEGQWTNINNGTFRYIADNVEDSLPEEVVVEDVKDPEPSPAQDKLNKIIERRETKTPESPQETKGGEGEPFKEHKEAVKASQNRTQVLIVRQACLKAAAEVAHSKEEWLELAAEAEEWVLR